VAAGLAGAALVAGFFLPWLDTGLGGSGLASGLDMVLKANGLSPLRVVLALVPLAGLALVAAAVKGGALATRTSLIVGLALLGYGTYQVGRSFIEITGLGLWLVIAGTVVAVVAPLVGRGAKAASGGGVEKAP
jgi:hypothetical protein